MKQRRFVSTIKNKTIREKIDQLVYELYELTSEEIQLIEGAVK